MSLGVPLSWLSEGVANHELWAIVLRTLQVSGTALAVSALIGIPLGTALALTRFGARRWIVALVYTGMGFPPVVVGLSVYLLLSRQGPLGGLEWLFTPSAMVIAQVVIALPLVAGLTMGAVESVDPDVRLLLRALGASPVQEALGLVAEARQGVVASLVAGFGGIISEVGAAMLVGGNVEGSTRVLSTAIVLETRQGAFGMALALGGVLLALTFLVNLMLMRLQGTPWWSKG